MRLQNLLLAAHTYGLATWRSKNNPIKLSLVAPVTLALTVEPGTLVLQLIRPAKAHYLNNLSLMITNLLTELDIPVGPNRQNKDLQKTGSTDISK